MSINKELLRGLEEQLDFEILARDTYLRAVLDIKDEYVVRKIKEVIEDEIRHMQVVDGLICLIRDYKGPITQSNPVEQSVFAIDDSPAVIFFQSSLDKYVYNIIPLLKGCEGRKVVYVSYNKVPKYTKKVFSDSGVKLDNISFINCSTAESQGDLNLSPWDLNKLSEAISGMLRDLKDEVLVVDTVSALSNYNDEKSITEFFSSISNDARARGYRVFWIDISDINPALNSKLSQLSDETVRI